MQLYRKRADGTFVEATERDIRSAVGKLNVARVDPAKRSGGRVWKKCSGRRNCRCESCYRKRGIDPRTLRSAQTDKQKNPVVSGDNRPDNTPKPQPSRPSLAIRSSFTRW